VQRFMMGLHTGGDDPSFNRCHVGTNPLLLLETLTDHVKQEGGFVMFEGTLRQPGDDWRLVIRLNPVKPEMLQHGIEVGTAGHATLPIVLQRTGIDLQLTRQGCNRPPATS
jgi:hypothetical protein